MSAPSPSPTSPHEEAIAALAAAGGNAAAAIAAIEAWRRQRRNRTEPDWHGLLTQIGDRLREIERAPYVSNDRAVRRLLAALTRARSMPDLLLLIDQLAERVAVVLAQVQSAEIVPPVAPSAPPSPPAARKIPARRMKLRL
ncbi:MAG: hypothetical protein ACOYJQ_13255 [Pseudochelatococcus sp.]|jgi:hypothetical protein|uniref:hypothetical protein n=1 Tax=Pseudochelatococcus sp. TaxID=2020869 RepID=UPI003D8EEB85